MSEEKIDYIIKTLDEHRAESKIMHQGIEARLRIVENTQNQQKGALRLITILGLPGVAGLTTIINKILG